jgi:hypothetical protein
MVTCLIPEPTVNVTLSERLFIISTRGVALNTPFSVRKVYSTYASSFGISTSIVLIAICGAISDKVFLIIPLSR